MSVLLIRPSSEEATHLALKVVADRFPGAPVAVFVKGEAGSVRSPEGAALEILRRRSPGGLAPLEAVRLWWRLSRRRFREAILPYPGAPLAPAPFARFLFFGSLPGTRAWILDDRGRLDRLRLGGLLLHGARTALFRVLDGAVKLLARGLVAALAPEEVQVGDSARRRRPGATFVLPILPDLSHTFLYREVSAILEQAPASDVVCLERGRETTVHPEAEALLARTRFVARRGVVGRHLVLLRRMLRSPRAAASLFALYARSPGGSPSDLLGRLPLQEPRHPGNAFELAEAVESRGGGHLHVYGSAYPANVAMGAAILLGIPFSVSAYEDFDFPYRWKMLDEKRRLATFLRATTESSRDRLAALLGSRERIHVIPWGIDASRWAPGGPPAGQGLLVTACRLVEKKGLRHVVPALAALRGEGVPFRWVVVGEGPEEPVLRALARETGLEDRIEFAGPRTTDEVRRFLARADAAVLPCVVARDGDRDGIPTFLLEAMLCEVPVVTSPVSGIPELVHDGETGFLAAPGDSAALARALAAVLRDSSRAREVARRGREAVVRTQDVADSARRVLDRIATATSGAPGGSAST